MATRGVDARPGRATARARDDDATKARRRRGRTRRATRTRATTTTTTTRGTREDDEATWTRAKIAVRRRIEGADEDVYANALASEEETGRDDDETRATTSTSSATHAMDVLAFRRLSAMMNMFENNVETHGIARQMVVITAGADTRAFRLPFPSGTAIFECADGTVHAKTAAVMKKVGAKPSRGVLAQARAGGCDRDRRGLR